MTDLAFDLVVFDLDGTLADTAPDLADALNHALGRLGRPPIAPERVRHLVGHGARALLRKGLAETGASDEALIEAGFPHFIDYYGENICRGTTAYSGVDDALHAIKARGMRAAVCTNKPQALSHLLIDALGWAGRFEAVVGGDTLAVRKPDPAPLHEAIARAGGGRAVFVGDSITDADTAKAAGVAFVAVSFGFLDRPVEQLAADAVIDHFDDLIAALDELGSITARAADG